MCLILLRCDADTEIANAVGITAGQILYGDEEREEKTFDDEIEDRR